MALEPLKFGMVTGRLVATIADSAGDSDRDPDVQPLTGGVTFTPAASALLLPGASPDPATALPMPITAILDDEGYLSHNGVRGVRLVASVNNATNPSDFTYKVSFALRMGTLSVQYPAFDIMVPADGVVDLTTVAPVPRATGTPMIQGVGIADVQIRNGEFVFLLTDGSERNAGLVPVPDSVNLGDYARLEDLASFATRDELDTYVSEDEIVDKADRSELSSYAKIEALDLKADKTELDGVVRAADLADYARSTALESFATQEDLQSKADKSELAEYAKATALDSKADKTALSGYATTTALTDKADRTELSSYVKTTELSGYATKTELGGYATKTELGGYATSAALVDKADKTALSGLATKTELSDYAKTSELPAALSSDRIALVDKLAAGSTASQQEADTLAAYNSLLAQKEQPGTLLISDDVELASNWQLNYQSTMSTDAAIAALGSSFIRLPAVNNNTATDKAVHAYMIQKPFAVTSGRKYVMRVKLRSSGAIGANDYFRLMIGRKTGAATVGYVGAGNPIKLSTLGVSANGWVTVTVAWTSTVTESQLVFGPQGGFLTSDLLVDDFKVFDATGATAPTAEAIEAARVAYLGARTAAATAWADILPPHISAGTNTSGGQQVITRAEYESRKAAGTLDPSVLYMVTA